MGEFIAIIIGAPIIMIMSMFIAASILKRKGGGVSKAAEDHFKAIGQPLPTSDKKPLNRGVCFI